MRVIFATWVAKLIREIARRTGKGGGTSLPGLVALRICPNYVEKMSARLSQGSVVITGTNGKTTTAALFAEMARKSGREVVHNSTGSNLLRGIATIMASQAGMLGGPRADLGIFEVDEATMPEAVGNLKPRLIIVTNLFRDQLDRYGELDKTAEIIRRSVLMVPEAEVLLCADDPLVTSIGTGLSNRIHYFGLEDPAHGTDEFERATDSKDCPVCGNELIYKINYYGHLGAWECPKQDLRRPTPEFSASGIVFAGLSGSEIKLRIGKGEVPVRLRIPGLYSVYNAVAATGLATLLGIAPKIIQETLESGEGVFGRIETISVGTKKLVMILVKNPAGANQALTLLALEPGDKNVLLALNDKFADGTDVSWIWDTDFERLEGQVARVVTSGIRAPELGLRLKYAGVDMKKVSQDVSLSEALAGAIGSLPEGGTLYVLPTYTAMLELRGLLSSAGHVDTFWRQSNG
jgi:UDP-N-acetylmuramyl tripeptide synthase